MEEVRRVMGLSNSPTQRQAYKECMCVCVSVCATKEKRACVFAWLCVDLVFELLSGALGCGEERSYKATLVPGLIMWLGDGWLFSPLSTAQSHPPTHSNIYISYTVLSLQSSTQRMAESAETWLKRAFLSVAAGSHSFFFYLSRTLRSFKGGRPFLWRSSVMDQSISSVISGCFTVRYWLHFGIKDTLKLCDDEMTLDFKYTD